jgi:hypothetical protein
MAAKGKIKPCTLYWLICLRLQYFYRKLHWFNEKCKNKCKTETVFLHPSVWFISKINWFRQNLVFGFYSNIYLDNLILIRVGSVQQQIYTNLK